MIAIVVLVSSVVLAAWPIFGTSDQLLASLTLLAVSVWLIKTGRNAIFTLVPMAFMLVMTLWSLVLQIAPWLGAVFGDAQASPDAPNARQSTRETARGAGKALTPASPSRCPRWRARTRRPSAR